MNRDYVYTVLFTLLISALLTAVLAGANAFFLPQIERNAELAEKRAILQVLQVEASDDEQVERMYQESVRPQEWRGLTVYALLDPTGTAKGFAIPMVGAGLWGTIQGYLGVTKDVSGITGIEFTDHNETPGLGSRIDEPWYKEQFVGIRIANGQVELSGPGGEAKVDAITGATSTSLAVLNIVRATVEQAWERWEARQ